MCAMQRNNVNRTPYTKWISLFFSGVLRIALLFTFFAYCFRCFYFGSVRCGLVWFVLFKMEIEMNAKMQTKQQPVCAVFVYQQQ